MERFAGKKWKDIEENDKKELLGRQKLAAGGSRVPG